MSMEDVFDGVTVFILAYNETDTLKEVVDTVCDTCEEDDVKQIILAIKNDRCLSYGYAVKMLEDEKYGKVRIYLQRSADLVSCFPELPPLTVGSHFIIMASDVEMDPHSVPVMIKKARQNPKAIICASKWMKGSVVEGYGFFHKLGTASMNFAISLLVRRKASDPVSVFEIFPVSLYNEMHFSGGKDFLFEYNIKPLISGAEYEEIPTVYRKKPDRRSNFEFITLCKVAVKFILTAAKFRFGYTSEKKTDHKKS